MPSGRLSFLDSFTLTYGVPMKTYVMTTGAIFGLLVVAHIWRIIAESPSLATDPFYVVITIVAALLSLWAWRLLWLSRTP